MPITLTPKELNDLIAGKPVEIRAEEPTVYTKTYDSINISIILCGGVYILSDEDRILYVGETSCLAVRIASHISDKRIPFCRVEFMLENNAWARSKLEVEMISRHKPPFNSKNARQSTVRNANNQFRNPEYESSFNKSNIVDSDFDN